MDINSEAFSMFRQLYENNSEFAQTMDESLKNGNARFFGEEEWEKIESQNFISPSEDMKEFIDMFRLGYNIGNCGGASRQLSFSYNDVDIVSGILPMIKGTLNAEKEGGHCWLERGNELIDTSLMLVMDKSLKERLGYVEEERLTSSQLARSSWYQARKEFVNDRQLRQGKKQL